MENLFKTVQEFIKETGYGTVARELGYNNSASGIRRLKELCKSDSHTWFQSGGYDLRYSNVSLFKKICELANTKDHECIISQFIDKINSYKDGFKPYIFIDTGFKREGQSVWMLSMMESKRYIKIPLSEILEDKEAELSRIIQLVRMHYEAYSGKISFWGNIKRYLYYQCENEAYEIIPEGLYLKHSKIPHSKASIRIKGKDISNIL
jgi:hypothetical protein